MDKYTIIKELAHGLMGTVYLVKDKDNKKYVMKYQHIQKS